MNRSLHTPNRLPQGMALPLLRALPVAIALGLSGCANLAVDTPRSASTTLMPEIRKELASAGLPAPAQVTVGPQGAAGTAGATGTAVESGPTASLKAAAAVVAPAPAPGTLAAIESSTPGRKSPRFDLNVSQVSATAVFAAIAHDSRLSVLVDPNIKGSFTVSLKDVTVLEALEALQELYGFEYKVLGRKLVVQPAEPQTRVFKVNYPVINRSGRSEVRVSSGSISSGGGGPGQAGGGGSSGAGNNGASSSGSMASNESSRISTSQRNDLWGEIEAAVKLLVPEKDNTQVVVSPQTGSIIVRAMPANLRSVERYLDAARLQVERQVMIEAKIIEVSLNDSTSAGINWSAFKNALSTGISAGIVTPGAALATAGQLIGGGLSALPGATLAAADSIGGGLFGLAFQTSNFAAVLTFLETQGGLQVLSSPRIATLNNQKAVLKVGSDDFFVTNISTTTSSTGTSSTTSPTISVQPFFSGISLGVTPQIDQFGQIIMHVHPQVTTVKERSKVLNLGSLGSFTLPLASSSVNESDSIVRVSDGSIFAIGGLMRQEQSDDRSGVPGTGNTVLRNLLGQTARGARKQELVILLKPSIIVSSDHSDLSRSESLSRMLAWLDAAP
jgi:MSHA biogenesis protein MshL